MDLGGVSRDAPLVRSRSLARRSSAFSRRSRRNSSSSAVAGGCRCVRRGRPGPGGSSPQCLVMHAQMLSDAGVVQLSLSTDRIVPRPPAERAAAQVPASTGSRMASRASRPSAMSKCSSIGDRGDRGGVERARAGCRRRRSVMRRGVAGHQGRRLDGAAGVKITTRSGRGSSNNSASARAGFSRPPVADWGRRVTPSAGG